MPLNPELAGFINRAIVMLDAIRVRIGEASARLTAMNQLAEFGTDEMVRSIIRDVRTTVKDSLDAFGSTDFETADLHDVP